MAKTRLEKKKRWQGRHGLQALFETEGQTSSFEDLTTSCGQTRSSKNMARSTAPGTLVETMAKTLSPKKSSETGLQNKFSPKNLQETGLQNNPSD